MGRAFRAGPGGLPDMAWDALYLASDMSSWLTGHTMVIDGWPPMTGLDSDDS